MSDPAGPAAGRELAELIAAAVLAVPGVAGLHGGVFGETATYLPGRRVAGIRRTEHGTEVHVVLILGAPLRATAAAIRAAAAPLADGPVHLTVEDVISP